MCEVRGLQCSVSPREISTFSVDLFKFSNMQICFSACEQLNITKKKLKKNHYLTFRLWRVGGWEGSPDFAHTGQRIRCKTAGILAAV